MDLFAPSVRTSAGLRPGFVACYREEFAFVWRGLLRLGVARAECDDAAQDVFVTAYRRWSTLRDPARRRAWLFGIVRRIAWRHRRTDERRDRRIEAITHAPAVRIGLDEEVARREAWTALADFLDALDEEKRAAFVLGEFEELSRTELGDALGINANTAYSRLQAARRSFFAHFAAYDDERAAQLLARATLASDAPAGARDRTWASIVALLAAPSAAAGVTSMGWAAVAVAIAVAGGVAAIAAPHEETTSSKATVEPTAAPPSPRVELAPTHAEPGVGAAATMDPARPPSEPAIARKRARAATTASVPETIDAEVAVLVAARAALVRGDRTDTQRHLDDHSRRFGTDTALADLRAQIERDLAAASIAVQRSGDSIRMEHPP